MKPISILITVLITVALCFSLRECNKESSYNIKGEQYWQQQNAKAASVLNQKYEQSLSALASKNDSLMKQLSFTKTKLNVLKQQQHATGIKITALAQNDSRLTIAQQLSNCDSLKTEALNYIKQADSTQALYDSTIVQLENVIAVKDTSLNICKRTYEELSRINEDNLRRGQKLTDALEKSVKQDKRKRIQNKFLAGGLLVLSGITTSFLINAKGK